MRRGNNFEEDFETALELFPKLRMIWDSQHESWYIKGQLDICDEIGEYWDSFDIQIIVPKSYPHCVPLVKEVSRLIKRDIDWHISKEGICCLDIDHKMLFLGARGIKIRDFIRSLVYPYFANQLYRMRTGKYAGEEFRHHFGGIQQFFSEDLKICDAETAILILEAILNNKLPGRNDPCVCRRRKFKKCHLTSVEFLSSLPKARLEMDLVEYKKVIGEDILEK